MELSIHSSWGIAAYVFVVVALLGLVMGSFLNCLAWRYTHGESVLRGRSHCVSCGHVLAARDLVPVFSWLFSRGRCRYCGERVSARYPATELLCACVYVALVARYDLTLEAVEMIAFASVLLVLSLTDIDSYIIPNGCILAAIVIRIAYLVINALVTGGNALTAILWSLVGGLAVGLPMLVVVLIMDRVLGRPSMGGGDLKLFAVAGMYFSWMECLFLVLVACVLGIAVAFWRASHSAGAGAEGDAAAEEAGADGGAGLNAVSDVGPDADSNETDSGLSAEIPWGPSIAAACVLTMLVGSSVTNWYLSLF